VTTNSRTSLAGAGWERCSGCGDWKADVPPDAKPLSWLRPGTLWRSRNDIIARRFHDPVDAARMRWVALARARARRDGASEDFIVPRGDGSGSVSFLVAGDTGEGDDSQYAVVPGLVARSEGVDFAVLCSDLTYPTGDIGDFENRFYLPYAKLDLPLFALPGNHDWYDGLHGFMHHLCGIDEPDQKLDFGGGIKRWLAERLWRRAPQVDRMMLEKMKTHREGSKQVLDPPQPGPYIAIDAGPLRLVAVDTGIQGQIDAEQAAWLRRVSFGDPKPKILLTGKPIYVDNKHHPGPIDGESATVDDIITDPRANFVAAIGGDIHNYQRYPVRVPGGRVIQYVVSGGGGAFMHATHQIPKVDVGGVKESEFRCYPLRGDSLARYSQLYDRKLHTGRRLELTPDEGMTYMCELLDMPLTRPGEANLSTRARWAGKLIQPLPATRGFHKFVSEAFDWNDPPMFKSFLRVDATPEAVRVRCFGVSGCKEAEHDPPVEDEFTIPLA
jgi:hypothetical protein